MAGNTPHSLLETGFFWPNSPELTDGLNLHEAVVNIADALSGIPGVNDHEAHALNARRLVADSAHVAIAGYLGRPIQDRARMVELNQRLLEPGTMFSWRTDFDTRPDLDPARYIGITAGDRSQLLLASDKALFKAAPVAETDGYQKLRGILEDGAKKGLLLSMETHAGTRMPSYYVREDSRSGYGEGAVDKDWRKTSTGEAAAAIALSPQMFDLLNVIRSAEGLARDALASDVMLEGRNTQPTGQAMLTVGRYLKK